MDARFSRPVEAWSRCSPAEQVTTDSCGISSQRVNKILFYKQHPAPRLETKCQTGAPSRKKATPTETDCSLSAELSTTMITDNIDAQLDFKSHIHRLI